MFYDYVGKDGGFVCMGEHLCRMTPLRECAITTGGLGSESTMCARSSIWGQNFCVGFYLHLIGKYQCYRTRRMLPARNLFLLVAFSDTSGSKFGSNHTPIPFASREYAQHLAVERARLLLRVVTATVAAQAHRVCLIPPFGKPGQKCVLQNRVYMFRISTLDSSNP